MTTALLSDTRPFNQSAAADVVEKARSLDPDSQIALVLSVRAEDDDYTDAVEDCLLEIQSMARTVHTSLQPFDTFVDARNGEIRIKATPNFCLLLVQSTDLFWSVALDDRRR